MDKLAVTTACLEADYPPESTAAMLKLAEDQSTLAAAWDAWHDNDATDFCEAVETIIGEACTMCEDCGRITWRDEMTWTAHETSICDAYCLSDYDSCERCGQWHPSGDMTRVGDYDRYCDRCRDCVLWYCDSCDEYFHQDDGHGHDDDDENVCDCEAPRRRFAFPANGAGTIGEDERLTVHLPRGEVDEAGLLAIKRLVAQSSPGRGQEAYAAVDSIGATWQTKRGNFTRRLSSALHKVGVKVGDGVLSEVGNLARAHSSGEAAWEVELTRDLNQSAGDFYHGESCWWGSSDSYGGSRCCLKQWGGLGMRTYADADSPTYSPTGRAWVQPLGADLRPTHDANGARAYVVYNGYGQLEGYTAARIVAYLTGYTYRRVTLDVGGQFVNGDVGYLIADESTCEAIHSLSYSYDAHDVRDARTFDQKESAA